MRSESREPEQSLNRIGSCRQADKRAIVPVRADHAYDASVIAEGSDPRGAAVMASEFQVLSCRQISADGNWKSFAKTVIFLPNFSD